MNLTKVLPGHALRRQRRGSRDSRLRIRPGIGRRNERGPAGGRHGHGRGHGSGGGRGHGSGRKRGRRRGRRCARKCERGRGDRRERRRQRRLGSALVFGVQLRDRQAWTAPRRRPPRAARNRDPHAASQTPFVTRTLAALVVASSDREGRRCRFPGRACYNCYSEDVREGSRAIAAPEDRDEACTSGHRWPLLVWAAGCGRRLVFGQSGVNDDSGDADANRTTRGGSGSSSGGSLATERRIWFERRTEKARRPDAHHARLWVPGPPTPSL